MSIYLSSNIIEYTTEAIKPWIVNRNNDRENMLSVYDQAAFCDGYSENIVY